MEWLSPEERLWKYWDKNLELTEQKKRLKRSFEEVCQPFYISQYSLSGTFSCQEGTFVCSIEDNFCNCDEHMGGIHSEDNKVPCKYMYRLAYERGITYKNGKLKKVDINSTISEKQKNNYFEACLNVLEGYDESTQKNFRNILRHIISFKRYYDNKSRVFVAEVQDVQKYIDDGLVEVVNDNLSLFGYQRAVVREMEECGFIFPENLERTKQGKIKVRAKYDWCLQHPDFVASHIYTNKVAIVPSQKLQVAEDLINTYLYRKFNDTIKNFRFQNGESVTIRYPVGAKITDYRKGTFEFPDDVVTKALNHYGYNRCENYTPASEVYESHFDTFIFELC